MEFNITRENFLDGLNKTQSVVEKKNTIPVLSNVLLEADKNGLKISATDLEVALITQVPAQTITPGRITVLCKSLNDIVREIKAQEIKVTLAENDRIEIKSGTSIFKIPGLTAKEFPALPKIEAKSLELSSESFVNMIEKTSFSMAIDDTRHNLAGVLLQKNGHKGIRMVSTDGHRLSLIDSGLSVENLEVEKVIIPRKGVNELKKLISSEGFFEMAVNSKHLFARKGNETLFVRLIDGDFPDYDRVIPKSNSKKAVIPREKLIGALRRVSLLANEKSRGVVLHFSPSILEVSINNPDLGEAKEEFDIDYKFASLAIGFNARYFLDALDVMEDDSITLLLDNELSPCILQSEKDEGFLSVVMPMRI